MIVSQLLDSITESLSKQVIFHHHGLNENTNNHKQLALLLRILQNPALYLHDIQRRPLYDIDKSIITLKFARRKVMKIDS